MIDRTYNEKILQVFRLNTKLSIETLLEKIKRSALENYEFENREKTVAIELLEISGGS